MRIGTYVEITFQKLRGRIVRIRFDSDGRAIYTIRLDDSQATPDGWYYARDEEIHEIF